MTTLIHHPFCPHSRFVRLALGEYGALVDLQEERVWERREEFLLINPAGATPVLIEQAGPPVPGAGIIAEYLDERYPYPSLLPSDPAGRARLRMTLTYRFLPTFSAGLEYNPIAGKVSPLANWLAIKETTRRPALILGTSSDRIGTPSGQSFYGTLSKNRGWLAQRRTVPANEAAPNRRFVTIVPTAPINIARLPPIRAYEVRSNPSRYCE